MLSGIEVLLILRNVICNLKLYSVATVRILVSSNIYTKKNTFFDTNNYYLFNMKNLYLLKTRYFILFRNKNKY